MKKTQLLKGALLAGITAAAISSAHAQYSQGDAVVAFTTGTGNDLIYDLGSESSLFNGEQFSLGSFLTGNLALANNPTWAVVAVANNNIYTSYLDPSSPAPSVSGFNGVKGSINQIGNNITTGSGIGAFATPTAATQYSFYYDNNPANPDPSILAQDYINVGTAFSGASQVEDFWAADKFGDSATQSGLQNWTLASDGTLTYGVPEPTTYALFTGAGLMMLAVRRFFTRTA